MGKSRRRTPFGWALAAALSACAGAANAATIHLRASLDGAQVPLAVAGTGTGVMIFDTVSKVLSWSVSYQDLTGECTDAHFHGPAPAGVDNAPTVAMSCSASPLAGSSAALNETQEAQLLSGQWYINIHTAAHPGGENRGQVVRVRGDASGDGNADVLWRNAATGENYLYPMNGTAILGGEGYLRTVAELNWNVAGIGDFDGDGKADVLWRNASSGENYLYFLNGTTIANEGYIRTVADQNWQVAGVGDFDGDAKDDILWRNGSTGENYLYPMNGLAIKPTEGYLRTVADFDWNVARIGDFDGDGRADVLWRNAVTGENYVYLMNATAIAGEGFIRTVADPDWQVAGAADFDGDGRGDIFWRNASSGENYLYPMAGLAIRPGEGYLRTVTDTSWPCRHGRQLPLPDERHRHQAWRGLSEERAAAGLADPLPAVHRAAAGRVRSRARCPRRCVRRHGLRRLRRRDRRRRLRRDERLERQPRHDGLSVQHHRQRDPEGSRHGQEVRLRLGRNLQRGCHAPDGDRTARRVRARGRLGARRHARPDPRAAHGRIARNERPHTDRGGVPGFRECEHAHTRHVVARGGGNRLLGVQASPRHVQCRQRRPRQPGRERGRRRRRRRERHARCGRIRG
jgi:hypothetical protein